MSNDKKQFDAETNKQISRAAAIEAMLGSAGWSFAEEDLMEFIKVLKDVSSIDVNGDVNQQVRDHVNAVAILEEWLESLKSQVNNAIIVTEKRTGAHLVERR